MSAPEAGQAVPAGYVRNCIEHGMLRLRERRLDEAMAEFEDALRHSPGSAEARFGLGECLMRRGKYNDAMARYLECLEIKPGFLQARMSLGDLLLARGHADDAIRQFTLVSTADTDNVEPRFKIAKCREKKGQLAEAVEDYRKITLKFPDFIDAYVSAARCLAEQGRGEEAAAEYRRAIGRVPDRIDLRESLVKLLEQESRYDEAIAENQAIQALRPDDIEVRLDIAGLMDRGGMIKAAIEAYGQILEIRPGHSLAFTKRRILLREREQIDRLADRYLSRVINRMSAIDGQFREGMKLYIDGCYDDSAMLMGQEITGAPSAEAFFALGACLVRAGRLLDPIASFREAISLKADFPEAHTMLGILYERHNMLYESQEEYRLGVKEAYEQVMQEGRRMAKTDTRAAEPAFRFYRLT